MAKKKKSERHSHIKVKPVTTAQPRWHIPFILIVTVIAFLPSLNAGFVNWDDPDYVNDNFLIKDISRLYELLTVPVQGNHHPVTMFSLAVNYLISGDDAWSYHLFNLIFHLINCYLVYRLAFLLSKNSLIAFATALLFGIHPMHVESVAWISERKDVLYTLFFIAGHITFTKYIDTGVKKQYWLTLLFLVLALLSKPAAVIFPVSLFCIDLIRNRVVSFKLVKEKIIFFIPALIIGLLTISAQKNIGAIENINFGLIKNILFGCYGIMMYFIKMFLPVNQSSFYPFPPLNEELSPVYYIAPIFLLLLVVLIFFTWKKHKTIAFGLSFYLVNLLLVIQVFTVGSAVIAERYTYVPYIGLFFIAGYFIEKFVKVNTGKAYMILVPVALVFSVLTYLQCQKWESGETLWDNVIKNQPCSRAYSSRAALYGKEKDFQKAIEFYTKAVQLNKIDAESFNNRGNIYTNQQKFDSAMSDYKNALAVKPEYYVASDNLGALYGRKNIYDSALFYLTKAIQLKPDYKPPYNNRAITYSNMQRYTDAINDWQNFLRLEPNNADVINSIGTCYRVLGLNQEALSYIDKAISINSKGSYLLNRSYIYYNMKNIELARRDALAAINSGVQPDAAYTALLGIH